MASSTINVRVDKKLKKECNEIFKELGFGMTTAITMYLKAVKRTNGIPFKLDFPSDAEIIEMPENTPETHKKPIKKTSIKALKAKLKK